MPGFTLYNPLDQFTSYSVQYIMLAARTTEHARAFVEEATATETLAAIDQVQQLGDAVPYGSKPNTAFLVIDTRRFSQFGIDNLKYDVLINGLAGAGSHANMSTNVSLTVLDATGFGFVNFIQWLMDERMQTNFDGMVYMLRVIFVGHHPDGSTETVQTTTIPMNLVKFEMNLDYAKGVYEMEFMPNVNFDAFRHERWLQISHASSYFTGTGTNRLGDIIASFQQNLNDASREYYQKAADLLQKLHPAHVTAEHPHFGRRVEYLITLPTAGPKGGRSWADMTFGGRATGNATEKVRAKAVVQAREAEVQRAEEAAAAKRRVDVAKAQADATQALTAARAAGASQETIATLEQQAKTKQQAAEAEKAAVPVDSNFATRTGMQITAVLDLIFKQVPEIAALGGGRVGADGSLTFYKHFVGLTSDDDVVQVHVDVVEFVVPDVVIDRAGDRRAVGQGDFYQMVGDRRVPKNYAEFDYIFSGNNKDVMSFDMKMQNLTFLLSSRLNMGTAALQDIETHADTPDSKKRLADIQELLLARPYDALLMPKDTAAQLNNFSAFTSLGTTEQSRDRIRTTQDYTRNLSLFYAISPIVATITIRGNPLIMAKVSQDGFLPHAPATTASASTSAGIAKTYRQKFEETILRKNVHTDAAGNTVAELTNDTGAFVDMNTLGHDSYASSPIFVTVNVFGPNVEPVTGTQSTERFAERLLMENYYVLFKVTNKIENSVFTQELELYSHNIFGRGKLSQSTVEAAK